MDGVLVEEDTCREGFIFIVGIGRQSKCKPSSKDITHWRAVKSKTDRHTTETNKSEIRLAIRIRYLCYKYDFDLSLWSVSQAVYTDFQAKGKKIKGHNRIQLAKSVNSELKDFVQRGPA